jgi:protein O-mannosyl-transferase
MNPNPKFQTQLRPVLFLALIVLLGTWAIYWPAGSFEFVSYDDPLYVPENAIVRQGLTWGGLKWAFTNFYVGHWHPLTWVSHMTICQLFGDNPAAHHLVNVVLHGLNALLFFHLLRRMTGAPIRSAFAAALFAWHPLRAESVAWVAEHKDLLAGAFWLLTIWAYLRYIERPGRARQAAMVGFFAAGLLCKAILITLPMVLLLLDVWPLRRLQLPGLFRFGNGADLPTPPTISQGAGIAHWRALLHEKLPLFGLMIVSMVITMFAGRGAGFEVPLAARVGNALVSYVRYAGKFFWPVDLAVLYPHPGFWPVWQVLGAAAILLIVSGLSIGLIRRRPYLAVGWFWFLGVLVPVIGLVQVGVQSMADRYSYVSMLGLAILSVWAAGDLIRHFPFGRLGAHMAAAIAAIVLAVVTRGQLEHWRNSVTLFSHAVAVTRHNAIAEYNLAQALCVRDQTSEAIPHYEAALRIDPKYDAAHNNLGLVYFTKGELVSATNHFVAALGLNPGNASAHYNQGRALATLGNWTGAISHYEEALRLEPQHLWSHYWIAEARAAQGQLDEAVQHYTETLRRMPDCEEALNRLGVALLRLAKPEQAMTHLERAIRLKPERAENHTQLGLALAALRRPEQAIAELRQAIALNPNALDALNNLAWLLATHPRAELRNGAEAVRLASRACELTSFKTAVLISTLAAACAETGRFDEAIQHTRAAHDLAAAQGLTAVADRNKELLGRYQSRKPFHELAPAVAP